MQKIIFIFLAALFLSVGSNYAQDSSDSQDSVEVTVIDSYISPELPHTFLLTFFTSAPAKSKVILAGKYEYVVSDSLKENHNIKIDLTKLNFKTKDIPFVIMVQDSTGRTYKSDNYDVEWPGEIKVQNESNFLLLCLFGGTVFLIPSPTYVTGSNGNYFSLTKEIPIISFRSANLTYPVGYFSAEYSHIFKADRKNFFRLGYKQVIEIPALEYVSPGVDWFTDFKGFNGVSAEFSVGWFKILNTFTLYTRYRYNIKPSEPGSGFSELSIGLYSSFFSIYF